MPAASQLAITLLPGARALLERHGRELPQRDDLCGAFCGALALNAAGVCEHGGAPLDQDAIARAAGSVVGRATDTDSLPRGEGGRRDYRLAPAFADDPAASGTTAAGLVRAIDELAAGSHVAIPYAGPWTVATLAGLFDLATSLAGPAALVANHATRHLWGTRPSLQQILGYLFGEDPKPPPADWDVGHFACVVGCAQGPRGRMYTLADTYRSLGREGVHLQPQECLAAALERREGPAGGVIVIASAGEREAVRAAAGALGLREESWDNGSVERAMGA